MIALWLPLVTTAFASPEDARPLVALWVHDPAEADRVIAHLAEVASTTERDLTATGPGDGIGEALIRQVVANLDDKRRSAEAGDPLPLSPREIERTVIDYEAFKAESYVRAGVFPKRYFGYFDGRCATAPDEDRFRTAVHKSAASIDAWLGEQGDPLRLTDAEVAVTFLAEGGALWMRDGARVDRLHPVFDVGLDDVASGDADLGPLRERLDHDVGTDLSGLVAWVPAGATSLPEPSSVPNAERWLKHGNGDAGPFPYLVRYMTLEEAVAGTAMMYLWEKRIAEKGLNDQHLAPLEARPLDEQFVISSLVYNSGRLHGPTRWKAILDFEGGEYIAHTSEANASRRPRLPVLAPVDALAAFRDRGYPEQNTSWLAAYHVLQRYGAFAALRRFTDVFTDDGTFGVTPGPPDPSWFPTITTADSTRPHAGPPADPDRPHAGPSADSDRPHAGPPPDPDRPHAGPPPDPDRPHAGPPPDPDRPHAGPPSAVPGLCASGPDAAFLLAYALALTAIAARSRPRRT